MSFADSSVGEFLGMIFFFPFVFYMIFILFTGIEDAIIFWFRRKDHPSKPIDL